MFIEKKLHFPYFAVVLGLLAFLCRYTGLVSIKIGNATSFLLLPLIVVVAMYYGELTAMFYGLSFGLIVDTVASSSYCYNTVFFLIAGFVAGILSEYVFNSNFKAALALCVIVSFAYFGLKWVFFLFLPDVQGKIYYLLEYSLPSAFYSSVFAVPLYFAESYLAERYKKKNKINNI